MTERQFGQQQRRRFETGETIFRQGESGERAYIIERGEVEISYSRSDGDVLLANLGEGEIFGEMALIDNEARSATAKAAVPTEVFEVDLELFQRHVQTAEPILSCVIQALLDRFRAFQQRVSSADLDADALARLSSERLSDARHQSPVHQQALTELKFEHELKRALSTDGREVQCVYQPMVSLKEGRPMGLEALVRWYHPELGTLAPDSFLPLAARSGLMRELDINSLQKACEFLHKIDTETSWKSLFMAVNLSGDHLSDDRIVTAVQQALETYQLEPHRLKLEVTESELVREPERAREILLELKALGVSLALDDFGTGYSSLSYLNSFPIDQLKIDRTFIKTLTTSEQSQDIVRAILSLASAFGQSTVAEGIEHPDQVARLLEMGCDVGQGYWFSRPLPPAALMRWLEDRT